MSTQLGEAIFVAVAFLFPFWPLVMLAPPVYRGGILGGML